MKKNVLALSIAAMIGGLGFAGAASAQALQLNEGGMGHMLVVPYYTAQNGNMTVFHVVNTDTSNGKAMKVRFRGAANSDDVLDFQVFMSPGDVWTAAVVKGADDVANLVTADGTCTLPAIAKNSPVPFVLDRLPSAMSAADKAANTREGYVEIFNMADITGNSTFTVGGLSGQKSPLFTAVKHVNGTAPCTSTVLNATLAIPAGGGADQGLVAPTDGLTGSWYVMNVPQTTTFAGAAAAIVATGTTNNVFSPQNIGDAGLTTADPLLTGGATAVIPPQHYDVPDLSTPYTTAITSAEQQASILTRQLARTAVINQYANDASVTAKTDWVFSMPTRRYSVAANYKAVDASGKPTAAYRVFNSGVTAADNVTNFFTSGNTSVNALGQICVSSINTVFFDREETFKSSGAVFSPGTTTQTPLCGEVSVLSFADTGASVLGSTVARANVTGAYTNGWGQIGFGGVGLPVLGASFMKLTNPSAGAGMSGTYGITWPHAYK